MSPDYRICAIELIGSFLHANRDALSTGKSFSPGESERAGFLRRVPGAGPVGNGGVGLLAGIDVREVYALVFLLSSSTVGRLMTGAALHCTKISADEHSFGARNHDLVTTLE